MYFANFAISQFFIQMSQFPWWNILCNLSLDDGNSPKTLIWKFRRFRNFANFSISRNVFLYLYKYRNLSGEIFYAITPWRTVCHPRLRVENFVDFGISRIFQFREMFFFIYTQISKFGWWNIWRNPSLEDGMSPKTSSWKFRRFWNFADFSISRNVFFIYTQISKFGRWNIWCNLSLDEGMSPKTSSWKFRQFWNFAVFSISRIFGAIPPWRTVARPRPWGSRTGPQSPDNNGGWYRVMQWYTEADTGSCNDTRRLIQGHAMINGGWYRVMQW